MNLGPGEHLAEFASQRFPATAAAGFEGSIEFGTGQSFAKVQAVALRYDNTTQDVFTTIPVTLHIEDPSREPSAHTNYIPPIRTTALHFPQVADGGSYRPTSSL